MPTARNAGAGLMVPIQMIQAITAAYMRLQALMKASWPPGLQDYPQTCAQFASTSTGRGMQIPPENQGDSSSPPAGELLMLWGFVILQTSTPPFLCQYTKQSLIMAEWLGAGRMVLALML